ncbi:MAG: hypothetical protein AAFZ99_09450 [Pseudomonadota bacterium]
MNRASVFVVTITIAALLGQTGPVAANGGPIAHVLCASGEDMRERLETRYRAHRAWAGLRGPDQVMELWENADGDWTLIITYAGGKRCIVAMGEALSPIAAMPHS